MNLLLSPNESASPTDSEILETRPYPIEFSSASKTFYGPPSAAPVVFVGLNYVSVVLYTSPAAWDCSKLPHGAIEFKPWSLVDVVDTSVARSLSVFRPLLNRSTISKLNFYKC